MNLASLLNLGGPDILVILVIVLLLFGARRLPDLFRGFGQAGREFREVFEAMRESRERLRRALAAVNPFDVVASVLLFVALTAFLLVLAERYPH
ncbi:MAG TPA: twin-arginine translocase TatA/TatE family subunit [Chthoniobacter sp.]